jgi:hypothetical protein
MANSVPEYIPNLAVAALDQEVLVAYDEVEALRQFATQELYSALHFKQVHHGEYNSSCGGMLRFASMGDYGTESETPSLLVGLRVVHESVPDSWRMSLSIAKLLDSFYRHKPRSVSGKQIRSKRRLHDRSSN